MAFVTIAIVVVWSVLFGAAYFSRVVGRLSRQSCITIVTGCYLVLSALALSWFGLTRTGLLGITGMLLPYAVGIAIVMIPFKGQRGE
ncbi:hypothetical protein [Rhodopila sp.]|uniref:hypothetical protein n=1 Tax=Rhodopila sp. TaxID=2480087 RepID=UPI003D0B3B42